MGLLVTIGTLILETMTPDPAVAATMGFVVFSLFTVVIALTVRDETRSAFNRDILSDRHQLLLYGLSLLFIIVPIELGFPRFLGLASLNGNQWLICIGFAIAYLLIDEVIKVFMRARRHSREAKEEKPAPVAGAAAA